MSKSARTRDHLHRMRLPISAAPDMKLLDPVPLLKHGFMPASHPPRPTPVSECAGALVVDVCVHSSARSEGERDSDEECDESSCQEPCMKVLSLSLPFVLSRSCNTESFLSSPDSSSDEPPPPRSNRWRCARPTPVLLPCALSTGNVACRAKARLSVGAITDRAAAAGTSSALHVDIKKNTAVQSITASARMGWGECIDLILASCNNLKLCIGLKKEIGNQNRHACCE